MSRSVAGANTHMLLLAGRHEARWLAVSPLVLAGLVVSAWLVWLNNHAALALWWYADVSIVSCLLAAAGGVLIAGQLAAGRARRDGMEALYASYPAPPAVRTGAQLLGVTGPLALTVVLTGAAVAWLDSRGALGTPRLWVLAAGLLLVALAGTLGVALGSWLRHPMGGILVVLVLGLVEIDVVLSWANPVHLPGGTAWLFPWSDPGGILAMLPGLTVPYPPPAHLAELAGLIVLAAAAAVWPVLRGRRAVAVTAGVAVATAGLTAWSGWSQARAVPEPVLSTLVSQAIQPARFESCQRLGAVRYCYYPAFEPLVRQWAVPVNGVLALLPRSARSGLTVRQVDDSDFLTPPLLPPTSLTSILAVQSPLSARLTAFQLALATRPGLLTGSGAPPVYTDLGWRSDGSLGEYQLGLALSTAQWATGLPTTGTGPVVVSCVPVGQARQSIALWLAAAATPAARGVFAAVLASSSSGASASGPAPAATRVGKAWVATVGLPGSGPSAGLTATVQGALLAADMLRLPERQVEAVLAAHWQYWLQPRTGLAALAAALRLRLPAQPAAAPPAVSLPPRLPRGKLRVSLVTHSPASPVCR